VTTALSRRTVGLYAAGAGPVAILGLPFTIYLPPYIAEGGVIPVALVGLMFSLSTLWDGIVDPLIGTMIDRKSRGEAPHRQWIFRAALPLLLLLCALVTIGNSLPFWLLLPALLLFYSCYSLYDVAHLSWGSALAAGDPASSARLFGMRELGMKLSLVLAFAAPAIAQTLIPDISLHGRILAYVSLLMVSMPLALWSLTHLSPRPIVQEAKINWGSELRLSLKSRPFMLLVSVQFFNALGFGALTSLFVFYSDAWLQLDDRSATLLFGVFIGGAIFNPFWAWAARRFGKPQSMQAMALWLLMLLAIGLLLPKADFMSAMLFALFLGSGFAGLIFIYGMVGDLAPHDAALCGRDRTAFLFAIVNLMQKAGTALGIAISYALLDLFAFDARNMAASAELVRNLYNGIPFASWTILACLLYFLRREPWVNQRQNSGLTLATPDREG
jgi:glycoside/pentoside/hexuronide:cation symporter, GPH family